MPRGGRGGRGGFRGGGGQGGGLMSHTPWGGVAPEMQPDGRPVELFPAYDVPSAAAPSRKERRVVDYYLLVR